MCVCDVCFVYARVSDCVFVMGGVRGVCGVGVCVSLGVLIGMYWFCVCSAVCCMVCVLCVLCVLCVYCGMVVWCVCVCV